MAIRINYNPTSVLTNMTMNRTTRDLQTSLTRLSSGIRLARSADDPSGMVLANALRYHRSGVDRAATNAEEAVSMLQTAESSMDQVTSLLQRARTLALNAANAGTQDVSQLGALQAELDNAIDSITRASSEAVFNGNQLLDGSLRGANLSDTAKQSYSALGIDWTNLPGGIRDASTMTIAPASGAMSRSQVVQGYPANTPATTTVAPALAVPTPMTITGPKGTATINLSSTTTIADVVALVQASSSTTGIIAGYDSASGNLTLESTSYGFPTPANFAITSPVAGFLTTAPTQPPNRTIALSYIDGNGITQNVTLTQDPTSANGLTYTTLTGGPELAAPYTGWTSGAFSVTVKDTSTGGLGATIQAAAAAVTATRDLGAVFQTGALSSQRTTVEIPDMRAGALGRGAGLVNKGLSSIQDLHTGLGAVLVNGQAQDAIKVIDAALAEVLAARGKVGAVQSNTMTPASEALRDTSTNLQSSESAIRDTDMAQESSQFARLQIMFQAATAMLAQANQVPQTVLQLLK